MSNVANLLTIAQGLGKSTRKAADRRLIKALQAPVANEHASQLNIYVVGDGNTVTIDQGVVSQLANAKDVTHALTTSKLFEVAAPPEAPSDIPRLTQLRGKIGTALDVKGEWYVRLEGEGGVLNPVSNGNEATLQDGQLYAFDGYWEGRSYRIIQARSL